MVGGALVPSVFGVDRRCGADGVAAAGGALRPHPGAGSARVVAGHDDEERSPRVNRGSSRLLPQATIAESAELTSPSVEERITDDVDMRTVLRAFAQLPDDDQQLLRLLCTVPPLDYHTIAEMLGRPIGSIGPTRARCLDRLKRLLPPGFDPKEGQP